MSNSPMEGLWELQPALKGMNGWITAGPAAKLFGEGWRGRRKMQACHAEMMYFLRDSGGSQSDKTIK
jgi:hypothetical protein